MMVGIKPLDQFVEGFTIILSFYTSSFAKTKAEGHCFGLTNIKYMITDSFRVYTNSSKLTIAKCHSEEQQAVVQACSLTIILKLESNRLLSLEPINFISAYSNLFINDLVGKS